MRKRISKLGRNRFLRMVTVLITMFVLIALPYKFISSALGIGDSNLIQLFEVIVTAVGALIVVFELRSGEHLNCCGMLAEMNFKFMENERLMRLFHELEECYKTPGKQLEVSDKWESDKVHSSDLMAYLTFYEVLFEHIDHGIITIEQMDDLFGDRFFKIIHNEYVQCHELYPQPSSYSNIFQLYSMWADYREACAKKHSGRLVALPENRIPKLYFNEQMYLHDTIYMAPEAGTVTLHNKAGEKISFSQKRLFPYNLKEAMNLQAEVMKFLPEGTSIFKYSSEEEFLESMLLDYCYGLYNNDELAAVCICVLNRDSKRNLCNSIEDSNFDSYITFDTIQVLDKYRGYGIHQYFLKDAEKLASRIMKEQSLTQLTIIATVSPDNASSLSNFWKQGYKISDTIPIYQSSRYVVTKLIDL